MEEAAKSFSWLKKKEEEKIITAGGVSFQSTIDLSFITLSLKK